MAVSPVASIAFWLAVAIRASCRARCGIAEQVELLRDDLSSLDRVEWNPWFVWNLLLVGLVYVCVTPSIRVVSVGCFGHPLAQSGGRRREVFFFWV